VVDRADSGWPGAAEEVVEVWMVLWSADNPLVILLWEPSAPTMAVLVIRP